VLLGGAAFAAVAAACSNSAAPVGAGDVCQLASDCAQGLVCVPQADGSRRCSSDLSGIVSTIDAGGGMDAAAEAAPAQDGTAPADGTTPTETGGNPETGTQPETGGNPPETGGQPETGGNPPETGAPETGTPEAGPSDASAG
jgi:hypothetical protein